MSAGRPGIPVAELPYPSAVVFDCDGTLMDTLPCADMAYDAMFARRGRVCPEEIRVALTGLAMGEAGAVLAAELGEAAAALAVELNDELVQAVDTAAHPLPGALETVRRTAAALPVAIASNSFRALLDRTLSRGGFAPLVPVTVAGDEVPSPKPAPDCYLAACAALGTDPASAVAVEDTPLGVRAATAAGMTVIAIGAPDTHPGAHAHITGLADPVLAAWPRMPARTPGAPGAPGGEPGTAR